VWCRPSKCRRSSYVTGSKNKTKKKKNYWERDTWGTLGDENVLARSKVCQRGKWIRDGTKTRASLPRPLILLLLSLPLSRSLCRVPRWRASVEEANDSWQYPKTAEHSALYVCRQEHSPRLIYKINIHVMNDAINHLSQSLHQRKI
jgi:hypothetical protein